MLAFAGKKVLGPIESALLAMQKVEGSSPFIRFESTCEFIPFERRLRVSEGGARSSRHWTASSAPRCPRAADGIASVHKRQERLDRSLATPGRAKPPGALAQPRRTPTVRPQTCPTRCPTTPR